MSFTLNKLTEGIRDRHVGQQNKRLVEKWSRTGLLRGMEEVNRENMATLLENQAAQVLRESNTMAAGEVGGFTNIAFPIVRRVFGGLIANELVSIQPMSLPSGLLFYLDYTYGSANGPHKDGGVESIYGGPAGKAIQAGSDAVGGQYDLVGSGFSRKYKEHSAVVTDLCVTVNAQTLNGVPAATGSFGDNRAEGNQVVVTNSAHLKLLQHDSQIIDRINDLQEGYSFFGVSLTELESDLGKIDESLVRSISVTSLVGAGALDSSIQDAGAGVLNVRRLTQLGVLETTGIFTPRPDAKDGDISTGSKKLYELKNKNSKWNNPKGDKLINGVIYQVCRDR